MAMYEEFTVMGKSKEKSQQAQEAEAFRNMKQQQRDYANQQAGAQQFQTELEDLLIRKAEQDALDRQMQQAYINSITSQEVGPSTLDQLTQQIRKRIKNNNVIDPSYPVASEQEQVQQAYQNRLAQEAEQGLAAKEYRRNANNPYGF